MTKGTPAGERLFWLPVECPVCQCRPPLKIPAAERVYARTLPPDQRRATWRCHCGEILDLLAQHYAQAA